MSRARDLADFNFDGKAVTINESSADLDFRVESDNLDDALFVQGSDGIVGVGTKTPAVASGYGMQIHNDTSGAQTRLSLTNNSTGSASSDGMQLVIENGGSALIEQREAQHLGFATSASERMRIDTDGNLLVGKTSLEYDSNAGHIFRADGLQSSIRSGGNVADFNRLSDDGEVIRVSKDGTTVGSIKAGNGDLLIGTGAVNLRFFDATPAVIPRTAADGTSNGAIDLGNSSNHFQNAYFTGTVFAEAFTGRDDTDTSIQMTGSNIIKFFTNSSEKMRLDQDGKLLLGTTSTIAGAHISHLYDSVNGSGITLKSTDSSGNTHNQVIFDRNGSTVGTISTTASNTAYGTTSDRRLKSNIQDAESASDKIDALRVRQFDWNVDGSHQDYGLIAQELEPIEPLAVTGDADSDEMMGVDYSKLVPMLLKEIQELRSRVAALEAN